MNGPPGEASGAHEAPGAGEGPFSWAYDPAGEANLPPAIRWGRWGVAASFGGYLAIGSAVKILDLLFGRNNANAGAPAWMWPVFAVMAAPGVLGLALPMYAVARYPYFSLATAGRPRIVRTGRGIFVVLGAIFALLAAPFSVLAVQNRNDPEAPWMAYLAAEFLFVGWLLARYRPDKNPVVATWLALTFGFGVPLAPFYFPSLLVGAVRLRRALRHAPPAGAVR